MDMRGHADAWLAAWGARDIDAIMACYTENVEFTASTVARRWGRPDCRLHGKPELRRHFERGLELAPDLAFTEEALLTSPGGYALFYRRENREPGTRCRRTGPAGARRQRPRLLRARAALAPPGR